MMQKKAIKTLKILAAAAGVLAVLFFILTIRLGAQTTVFEPLFVLFLVCAYHCGVRLIMNTSLSEEDAADERKVRLVHILNIVLGLLSFVLVLFPRNRIFAVILIAAVTVLFSVNDLVVIRRAGKGLDYYEDFEGDSLYDENDEDILNTDASVKAAREEAEQERKTLRESVEERPEQELPSGRRRRRPVVLRPSEPVTEEPAARNAEPAARSAVRSETRSSEISAADAMAAMAGFRAALNNEVYAAGPAKMTFAKPAEEEMPVTDNLPERKLTRQEKKAAKAKAKAEKAARELEAAKKRQAQSEAALRRYGNPVEASTFSGLESVLRSGDRYYDYETDAETEERNNEEIHYQDELFSGNHDMFYWRGNQFDWTDEDWTDEDWADEDGR